MYGNGFNLDSEINFNMLWEIILQSFSIKFLIFFIAMYGLIEIDKACRFETRKAEFIEKYVYSLVLFVLIKFLNI